MHIPEQLFSLPLLKDFRTQQLELVFRYNSATVVGSAFIQSPSLFIVPTDRVFCVTSWCANITPDTSGGFVTSAALYATVPGLNNYGVLGVNGPGVNTGTNQLVQSYGSACSVWLPPGTIISVAATLNVAATHTGTFTLTGISFPRGSVAVG